jgi:hypothetical protein
MTDVSERKKQIRRGGGGRGRRNECRVHALYENSPALSF